MRSSGIWKTLEDEKCRYRLRLSPDTFPITPECLPELQTINDLIYADGGYLEGAISLYTAAVDPKLSGFPVWGLLHRSLGTGILKIENDLQLLKPKQLPAIVRLDLAETLGSPSFQIMEVEGDKTHAFGYSTIPI